MLILASEKRAAGHAYAALLQVRWGDVLYTLALQHHPVGKPAWESRLYAGIPTTPPLWQSERCAVATQAIDALLERIVPLGLPDDLLPLVNDLLPGERVGAPLWE
jgi:hypothetical protein